MAKVRIQGLVGLVGQIRRELAEAVTESRSAALREAAVTARRRVDELLGRLGARWTDLPRPSGQAYLYLEELGGSEGSRWPQLQEPSSERRGRMRFPGLRRRFEGVLDTLSEVSARDLPAISKTIRAHSSSIEGEIERLALRPDQITSESRAIRGWLAFFSDHRQLGQYHSACARATCAFAAELSAGRASASPRVHLRPVSAMYRIRPSRGKRVRVHLPTPAMTFDDEIFVSLAGLAMRRHRDRRRILEAMTAEEYRAIDATLELLGGPVEASAGTCHHLAESFDRVNREYFGGSMSRPKLTWSRSPCRRKLGHYDPVRDAVVLNLVLDSPRVPQYALDYIMYHELLHRKHGVTWRNGQARVHTAQFKEEERFFRRLGAAKHLLSRLTSER
jgi:hypothetical protein